MNNLVNQFDTCLVCGSSSIGSLNSYEANYLVKCADCKFVFSQRKPTQSELTDHYKLYFRGNAISPITIKRYNELLDKFEKYRKINNIMDVGCGDGYFLSEAKKRNWNVFGVEFSEEAIQVCASKGIQMTQSPLDINNYQPSDFDIITSFEVLEHINNPREELKAFNALLRKGGIVYATTPNFNSVSRNILGTKWNVIQYPEHLCYYTKRTISRLFNDHLFEVFELKTTGLSLTRLTTSLGAESSGGKTQSMDESLRQMSEKKMLFQVIKKTVNYLLNIFRKGDSIQAIFLKS